MASLDHVMKTLQEIGLNVSKLNRVEAIQLYNKLQREGILNKFYSCERKDKYPTMVHATKAAYNLDQIRPRQFEPYWCQWCGKYHVGGKKDRSEYSVYIRPEFKGTEYEVRVRSSR